MRPTTVNCPTCDANIEPTARKCPYCGASIVYMMKRSEVLGGGSDDEMAVVGKTEGEHDVVIDAVEIMKIDDMDIGYAEAARYAILDSDGIEQPESYKVEGVSERSICILMVLGVIGYVIFTMILGGIG